MHKQNHLMESSQNKSNGRYKEKYVKAIQLENCRREIIYSRVSLEDTSF